MLLLLLLLLHRGLARLSRVYVIVSGLAWLTGMGVGVGMSSVAWLTPVSMGMSAATRLAGVNVCMRARGKVTAAVLSLGPAVI